MSDIVQPVPMLPNPQTSPLRLRITQFIASNSTVLLVLVLLFIFGATSRNFLSATNIFNIWRQMSVVATLAIGMMLVVLIGGIDLSVGSVLFLSAGVIAVLLRDGSPAPIAIGIGLTAVVGVGLLNGVLVEIAGISPIITTLGTLIGVRGLTLVLMNNAQVRLTDPFLEALAVTRTPALPQFSIPGLQLAVVIVVVLYVLVAVLLYQTTLGRYLYAVGGNERAAYLCGVPVKRVKVLAYALSGLFAAAGGMLMAAQQGVIGPGIGVGLEFYAVAAVVLGGVRLTGGVGHIERVLPGAMLLYMILNYMTLGRIPAVWQQTATGLLVLGAVVADRLAGNRQP